MYDLDVPRDEREVVNLGNPATEVSEAVAAERERLHQRLIQVMESLGTLPPGVVWPAHWGEGAPKEPGRPADLERARTAEPPAGFEIPPTV
jgi:hypothetical protein